MGLPVLALIAMIAAEAKSRVGTLAQQQEAARQRSIGLGAQQMAGAAQSREQTSQLDMSPLLKMLQERNGAAPTAPAAGQAPNLLGGAGSQPAPVMGDVAGMTLPGQSITASNPMGQSATGDMSLGPNGFDQNELLMRLLQQRQQGGL